LALIGLTFFIRQQSLKNKQRILETEQRLNRARMNPHFFFNALSSLQSYALDGNDGKSIASNLSKFSHIMRETLESTYKEYVTIEQESDFLREYLELQKIRFPQKFSYTINIAPAIEPDDTLLPAMILQPFAENSIEHGFTGINYPGELTITFDKKEKDLHISIVDNGKGLVNTAKETSEHISRASQIIKDRIYLLNVKLKTKAAFTIDNNKNEKGVTVLIRLPLLYKQDKVV
jgi:sensor histidine kinase YesM